MVDNLGMPVQVRLNDYKACALLVDRFQFPSNDDCDRVLKYNQSKWMQMLDLPFCDPTNEQELENWADIVGRRCQTNNPSLHMLVKCINANASDSIKTVLGDVMVLSFEQMIDELALNLFGSEFEVMRIESVLIDPPRAE
eukprot:Lankesteria_metandrocarpae@DN5428_c2_g1_i2.p1